MDVLDFEYVSLSSGGTKGLAYFGLLDSLEDRLEEQGRTYDEWHENLKGVAGTSSGSFVGLVILLGVCRKKREELFQIMSDVKKHINPDLGLMVEKYGFEDGILLRRLIERVLSVGGLSTESTLGHLHKLLRKEFVCMSTNLNLGEAHTLSSTLTPDVRVVDAIFASCCIPFVFTPPIVNGCMLADGCLTEDQPFVFEPSRTLFLNIHKKKGFAPINSWPEFLFSIVRCFKGSEWKKKDVMENYPRNFVTIRAETHKDSLNLMQTPEQSQLLYRQGYSCFFGIAKDNAFSTLGLACLACAQTFISDAREESLECELPSEEIRVES